MKSLPGKLWLVVMLFLAGAASAQRANYVSVAGLPSNGGTLASPWSLSYALDGAQTAGKLHAGDTIYIQEGIYTGNFVSNIGFATGLPIIVKNYGGKRVTIDGNSGSDAESTALTINGFNTWFQGLEITSTSTQRIARGGSGGNGLFPEKIFICQGVEVYGKDIKIINCVIHDMTGTGLSSWKYSDNSEVYGCIIYNNGFFNLADSNGSASERGNGPGLYLQHLEGAKPKIIKNNFVFKNFSTGIQAKTVTTVPGRALNGINLDSNTVFNGGALNYPSISRKYNLYVGSEVSPANPAENIYVRSNVFYRDETDGSEPYLNAGDGQWKPAWYRQSNISFGTGQADSFLVFRNNYVVGSSYTGDIYVRNTFAQFDFQNNTLYDPVGGGPLIGTEYFSQYKPTDSIRLKGIWNNNRYFSKNGEPFWRFKAVQNKDRILTLQGFQQAMNVDANSTHNTLQLPADTAFVRQNKYENNVFLVTVLNHSKQSVYNLPFVNKSLSNLYYTVIDIQNYYGPQVTSGVYNGSSIMLPMNLLEVSKTVGEVPLNPMHTSAGLGTFIIRFSVAPPATQPCNPPTGLFARNTSSSKSLQLEWIAASGAAHYIIQQKNGLQWDSIGTTSNTNFIVNNVQRYVGSSFRVGTRCNGDTSLRFSNIARSPGKYFVTVNGSEANNGSFDQPWSLPYALSGAGNTIVAGDSIFIRGGIYRGNFNTTNVTGTALLPIVFINYDREPAVIDGYVGNNNLTALTISANTVYTYFAGLEVRSSSASRLSAVAGDMYTGGGIFVQGHGIKLINCIVHDMPGDGVAMDKTAAETELYGCLIYNNGYERASAAYGNGVNVQNTDAGSPKKITNSFVFKNNATGVFAYGSPSLMSVNGIDIDSSVIINTGAMLTNTVARKYNLLVGGAVSAFSARNINIRSSIIYRDETDGAGSDKPHNLRYNICFGQGGVADSSISLQSNHIVGGGYYGSIYLQSNFLRYDIQNNTFYTPDANNKIFFVRAGVSLPPIWDYNKYFSSNNTAFSGQTWDGWKTAFQVDANSSYSTVKPVDTFFIRKNKYDENTYYVTVMNYSKTASFRLPFVSNALAGGNFRVTDVQDYFGGIVASGSYNGLYLDLPMTNTNVAIPIGTVATQPKHTSPVLGTFIIKISERPLYCPGSNISFTSDKIGTNYTWQVNSGNGFVNIANSSNYSGANTSVLQLINMPYAWNNYQYRCVVDASNSSVFLVKFAPSNWTGAVSNAWENPANWECGLVPSSTSDVIVSGGAVLLGSNAACSTLTLKNNATMRVKAGFSLTLAQ